MKLHSLFNVHVPKGSLAIQWFGQSSYAIKTSRGTILLVDPFFPLHRPPTEYVYTESPLDETTIPANLVLVTHDHRDHNCIESHQRLLQANKGTIFLAPPEAVVRMKTGRIPEENIISVVAGDRIEHADMRVTAVYAKPPKGDPTSNIPEPDVRHLGFVVECDGGPIWFSGDIIHTFADLEEVMAPVRALAPRIGAITTHPTEGEFPFFDGSRAIAERLGLKIALPAHYDCFVKRTYDPTEWKAHFPQNSSVQPVIPEFNKSFII